jgi:hypothetical protein
MTQDEIIDMAIQAGASPDENKIWLMYAEEIETFAKLVAAKEREALAQPEQEPVALEEYDAGLLNDFGGGNVEWWWDYIRAELGRAYEHYQSQITTPPQRTWQGLTDKEIAQGWKESWVTEQAWQSAVWWAEDKLKEKNT